MTPFEALINSVRRRESSENPDDPNAVTKPLSKLRNDSGAMGVMQIKPSTAMDPGYGTKTIFEVARDMGFDPVQGGLLDATSLVEDPQVAEAFAADYLRNLNDRFGGYDRAAAAYNMGPTAMANWSGEYTDLPAETQDYVNKIRQYWTAQTGEPFPMTMSPRPRARPQGLLE